MKTIMNAEIASERIRSRNQTANAGRKRAADFGCAVSGDGTGAGALPPSVLGVSGMQILIVYRSCFFGGELLRSCLILSKCQVRRPRVSNLSTGVRLPRKHEKRLKLTSLGDAMPPTRPFHLKSAYRALTLLFLLLVTLAKSAQ